MHTPSYSDEVIPKSSCVWLDMGTLKIVAAAASWITGEGRLRHVGKNGWHSATWQLNQTAPNYDIVFLSPSWKNMQCTTAKYSALYTILWRSVRPFISLLIRAYH